MGGNGHISRFLTGLKLVGDRLIAFVHDHYGKAAIRMQVSGGKQRQYGDAGVDHRDLEGLVGVGGAGRAGHVVVLPAGVPPEAGTLDAPRSRLRLEAR